MIDIEVLISEEVSGVLTAETDDIRDYAVEVCRASNFTQTDINIVFIDDEKMTGLNETFSSQVKNKKLVKAFFCGETKCEDEIKDKTNGVTSRLIPFDQPQEKGKCIHCNKESKFLVVFGKAY